MTNARRRVYSQRSPLAILPDETAAEWARRQGVEARKGLVVESFANLKNRFYEKLDEVFPVGQMVPFHKFGLELPFIRELMTNDDLVASTRQSLRELVVEICGKDALDSALGELEAPVLSSDSERIDLKDALTDLLMETNGGGFEFCDSEGRVLSNLSFAWSMDVNFDSYDQDGAVKVFLPNVIGIDGQVASIEVDGLYVRRRA